MDTLIRISTKEENVSELSRYTHADFIRTASYASGSHVNICLPEYVGARRENSYVL